jgi:hypothetical protein
VNAYVSNARETRHLCAKPIVCRVFFFQFVIFNGKKSEIWHLADADEQVSIKILTDVYKRAALVIMSICIQQSGVITFENKSISWQQ